MRAFALLTILASAIAPVNATTLQQLSLEKMSRQATAIVHAKVLGANAVLRGTEVYTVYRIATLESLKAADFPGVAIREIAVPGGVAGGIRQAVEGAPALRVDAEYVLFLWTGRSGLTQIMGLSQGLFAVEPNAPKSDFLVTRVPAAERMLDDAGRPVREESLVMKWTELKAQVNRILHNRPLAADTSPGGR